MAKKNRHEAGFYKESFSELIHQRTALSVSNVVSEQRCYRATLIVTRIAEDPMRASMPYTPGAS